MTEYCRNCSSELFAGQRFCRACGAPTEPLADDQATTRMMPPQPEDWGARRQANTAPSTRPDTSPVYTPSSEYQPTAPMYPQMVPPYAPPRSHSRLGWVLAFIGMGLFVAVVIAVMMIAKFGRKFAGNAIDRSVPVALQPGENALSDSADQVVPAGNETAFIKSFALDKGASLSLRNTNGSITISTWDQPNAEVKAFQKGSDRNVPVVYSGGTHNVSIHTVERRGNQDIRYEVRLPREMGRVEISSINGSIKMVDVTGQIVAEGINGSVDLIGVSGVSRVKTVNGRIRSVLNKASDGPMSFETVSGSIDIALKPNFDATLDASAVQGSIKIDDEFGITVEKQFIGQHARGPLGSGGQPLKVNTVNGSIKLSKQQ
jgi:hypothetical protein